MNKHFYALVAVSTGCCGMVCQAPSFSLQVMLEQMNDAIPGQKCVLLVSIEDAGCGCGQDAAVSLSGSAPGAQVSVEPETITAGEVAEVTMIPEESILARPRRDNDEPPVIIDDEDEPWTVTATIRAERDGEVERATVPVTVSQGEDLLGQTAAEMRDRFIPWLAANHPDLGITTETEWAGTIVRPHIEVVMYYLFFCDQWEMGVTWHVMIPPHDWARIYLRRRFIEVTPSYAFEIPSLGAGEEPQTIEPPESVWR